MADICPEGRHLTTLGEPTLRSTRSPNGRTIVYDADDARGTTLNRLGGEVYPRSTALWRIALAIRDRWDVVVDVGANYGEMLVAPDELAADRVVAFEPNPRVAKCLRLTTEALPWKTEIIEEAVSNRLSDDGVLWIDSGWSGRSRIVDSVDQAVDGSDDVLVRTKQTTLSAFFAESATRNACVKVDVEGHEQKVLDGADSWFRSLDHGVVMIEILHMSVHAVHELAQMWPLYLLSSGDKRLVRWEGRHGSELGRLLYSGKVLAQDALLLVGGAVEELDSQLRRMPVCQERTAVFTVVGRGEQLREQSVPAADSGISLVCLTTDETLSSESWGIRLVEPDQSLSERRGLRHLRALGDDLLAEFDRTIFVDPDAVLPDSLTTLVNSGRDRGNVIEAVDLSAADGSLLDTIEGSDPKRRARDLFIGLAVADRVSRIDGARTVTLHIDRRSDELDATLAMWRSAEDRVFRVVRRLSEARHQLGVAEATLNAVRRVVHPDSQTDPGQRPSIGSVPPD